MEPGEVVPSPQLMVATKALAGSTPLAWVKVAVWKLVSVRDRVRMAPETEMAGSVNVVVAPALLLAVLGSGLVLVTETLFAPLPSSTTWPVTDAVTVPPAATLPAVKVTTPPETLNVTEAPSAAEDGPVTPTPTSALGLTLTTEPVTVAVLLAVLGSGLLA